MRGTGLEIGERKIAGGGEVQVPMCLFHKDSYTGVSGGQRGFRSPQHETNSFRGPRNEPHPTKINTKINTGDSDVDISSLSLSDLRCDLELFENSVELVGIQAS